MAIREIVDYTDEFIRKVSKPVKAFDENLHELLDDMKQTLIEYDGAGLSAVQVGVLKRAFVISMNGSYIEFVNPKIEKTSGKQVKKEGCLSVKGQWGYVERPARLTVSAFDRFGNPFTLTCTDWTAIVIMHEYDHLEGILFIDKVIQK